MLLWLHTSPIFRDEVSSNPFKCSRSLFFTSFNESKPFVERPKDLTNSQASCISSMVSTFSSPVDIMRFWQNSREVTSTVEYFFKWRQIIPNAKVASFKSTRNVAFLKSYLSIYQPIEMLNGWFKVAVPQKNPIHAPQNSEGKKQDRIFSCAGSLDLLTDHNTLLRRLVLWNSMVNPY